jgi:probable F420-dependent oxidoreductase
MKIDTLMAPAAPTVLREQAAQLEAKGFDCIWTFEAMSDPFLPLAHAADATSKIEIGTNIAVAFARSPFSMAQISWDLQRDSGGRFHLGLGTQVRAHVERRFSADFDHPAARIVDYIKCLRAIWDCFQNGTKPSYDGRFYKFKLMNPFFNPGPLEDPSIPVYLAGVNARMCCAAGEVADGFHVHPMHSPGYVRDVIKPSIAEGARSAGRDPTNVALYAPVFTITGDTQAQFDEMERTVRGQISFYGSTPSYSAVLEYHGYPDLGRELNTLMREGKVKEMAAAIPDALLEHLSVIGKPSEIGSMMRSRSEGLLDRVSLYSSMGSDGHFSKWSELISAIHG